MIQNLASNGQIFASALIVRQAASRLVNKVIDLYVAKEWLGHSTISVTEKYAHLAAQKLLLH